MTPPIFEEKQSMIKTWGGKIVILLGLVIVVQFIRKLKINYFLNYNWSSKRCGRFIMERVNIRNKIEY